MEQLFNLPRIFWAKKSWTMKELHLNFFDYFKDIIRRWLLEVKEKGNSDRANQLPNYQHNGETMTYDMFESMSLQEQFNACFPGLTEDNWKDSLAKSFTMDMMPY